MTIFEIAIIVRLFIYFALTILSGILSVSTYMAVKSRKMNGGSKLGTGISIASLGISLWSFSEFAISASTYGVITTNKNIFETLHVLTILPLLIVIYGKLKTIKVITYNH